MSYRIYDAAQFANRIGNNEEVVYADIQGNPGTDLPGILLRTAKARQLVEELIAVFQERRLIVAAYDTSGAPFYWTAGAFETAIWSKRSDARTWLAVNNGKTVAQMAASLGVHEAIACALAEGLRAEGKAHLVAV